MSNASHKASAATADRWATQIEQDTARLRGGSEPTLRRIRELVAQKGIEMNSSLVANLMPEDVNLLSGFIVTGEGGVCEFEYDWRRVPSDQGRLAVWRDITDTYQARAFREPISAAVAMVSHQMARATA